MPRAVDRLALALAVVGALAWELVGKQFGKTTARSRAAYALVDLAGLSLLAARVTGNAGTEEG